MPVRSLDLTLPLEGLHMSRVLSGFKRLAIVSSIAIAFGICDSPAVTPASAEPASSEARPNFSGIWERVADPMKPLAPPAFTPRAREAMNPELTPGEKIWAENGIDESDANCLPRRQPWMLLQSPPISIVHDRDKMILLYEKRSGPMHVYLDDRDHPDQDSLTLTLNGHSVGRWEGDELVVDSVGFADYPGHGSIENLPFLPTTRITQRFRLAEDGQELHARFTIIDPELLETPYVYDFTWRRLPYDTNYALVELCDAQNPDRLVY